MPPNPSLTALAKLRSDPRLTALGEYVPPLRLFGALGVARDEVAHSRLLATLLDPYTHAGAETVLRALLTRAADNPDTPPATAAVIRNLPTSKWNSIAVRRELYRVDVIADILAPNGLVVGIENKIDAVEGREQLGRYQNFLRDRFPGRSSLMFFLTPSGLLPRTAAPSHPVPCLAISYSDVLTAIEVARKDASNRDAITLELVATHLREEIMGEDDEIRKAVREVWRDHPNALRLLLEYRPQLSNMRNAYEVGIQKALKGVEFSYYPNRGEPREVKFWVPGWPGRFPFAFMLHVAEGHLHSRVLIYCDDYERHKKSLKRWAIEVNAKSACLIDEEFRPIPGWTVWRRVFDEEDNPVDSVIQSVTFNDETAKEAIERILDLVDRLRPYVESSL